MADVPDTDDYNVASLAVALDMTKMMLKNFRIEPTNPSAHMDTIIEIFRKAYHAVTNPTEVKSEGAPRHLSLKHH